MLGMGFGFRAMAEGLMLFWVNLMAKKAGRRKRVRLATRKKGRRRRRAKRRKRKEVKKRVWWSAEGDLELYLWNDTSSGVYLDLNSQ
jgi:hypothetical protein